MKYLLLFFIIFITSVSAQEVTYRSRVVDSETGEPLYKASIMILGTQTGAISDEKGDFSICLTLKEEPVLRVSYVGYETKYIHVPEFEKYLSSPILLVRNIVPSQTIIVTSGMPEEKNRYSAFEKIHEKQLKQTYTVQDIPQYLATLPSTTWYSESGNGIGYNYLSIRGFDQRRLAVMVNGIPQNDPEDHNVYWLDFNDILGSTDLIQVQRGTGNAVFGYPAVGGAINIVTATASMRPDFTFRSSVGAYNTRKYSATYSSGLINKKYAFTAKLSKTLSSGYREKTWVDYSAYYLSLLRFDDKLSTQFNVYGGPIADGLSYTGLPKEYIKDKKLRKKNYSYWEPGYFVERRSEEKENFSQPHFEILNEYKVNSNIRFNSALFLVLGKGFFDYDGSWANYSYYRLTPANGFTVNGNPDDLYMTNVLTRAQVENRQWGWIPRLNITEEGREINLGAEMRFHTSRHWGAINFANGGPTELTPEYKYYDYQGAKDMLSAFGNYSWNLNSQIRMLWEVQLVYNRYKIFNEKYLNNSIAIGHFFINPKFGVNYTWTNDITLFGSIAQVSREPRLKNYYDAAESGDGAIPQFELNADGSYNYNKPLIRPETMTSLEIGGLYKQERLQASVSAYFMTFSDEIVKNGQLDRFGSPMTGNVAKTNHLGLELSGVYSIPEGIKFIGNASFSINKISEGSTFIKYKKPGDSKKSVAEINLSGNTISGFPGVIVNLQAVYEKDELFAQLTTRINGSFYSDNYDSHLEALNTQYNNFLNYRDNVNDAFFTADVFVAYTFREIESIKTLKLFLQINNLLNNKYSQNAVGAEFFPAAEINLLTGFQLALD